MQARKISKVSIKKCGEYEYGPLRETLEEAVGALGGLGSFIKSGDRVLVKPNLLAKKKPEDATTTHPVFVRAVIDMLTAHGAKVTIGDSPGGPFTATLLGGIYKSTGMSRVAIETGAALNRNFGSFTKDNPEALIMKKLLLTDMLNDADAVVNLAKLKTHAMMSYTGAVKNMFGMVPGVTKFEYHLNVPDYGAFADALIDICIAAKPALSFIDGIVGMEGDGPAAGTPARAGAVLSSACPYSLDIAACRLIGLNEDNVPLISRIAARGLASADGIDYVHETPESMGVPPFRPAATSGAMNLTNPKIPEFVRRFVAKRVQTRPVFDRKSCNGCGVCRDSCPAKVIAVRDRLAAANLTECIRCYCCHELCPRKAISIKRPVLSKLMRL